MKVYAICANDSVMGIVAETADVDAAVERMARADYERDKGHWKLENEKYRHNPRSTPYDTYRNRLYWHTHGPFEVITPENV